MTTPVCLYSRVIYRHPELNAIPLVIGVLLVCPARNFGAARFNIRRAQERPNSPRFRRLRTKAHAYCIYPPKQYNDLEALYEASPLGRLSFSSPITAREEPEPLLRRLVTEELEPPQTIYAWHILYQAHDESRHL